jgi:prophage tail gpP-like protein
MATINSGQPTNLNQFITSGATTSVPPPPATELDNDNEVSIIVNGVRLFGFESIEIDRGIEIIPGNFTIRTTDKYATLPNNLTILPNDECVVMIGSDVVITGYVQAVQIVFDAQTHELTITGTSKSVDIVECAALFFQNPSVTLPQIAANPSFNLFAGDPTDITSFQITNQTIFSLAQNLLPPFNISLSSSQVNQSDAIMVPNFTLDLGTTVFEVLESFARYQGVLLYDDPEGNLVIAQAGTSSQSGTITNDSVQRAMVSFDNSNRFNQYIAVYQDNNPVPDLGSNGNLIGVAIDTGMPRYRPTIIQSAQVSLVQPGQNGDNTDFAETQSLAQLTANWIRQRNIGRSQIVRLTLVNWRDAAGALLMPNYTVNVNLPQLKIENTNLIISRVTYKKDAEAGTTCEMELMPPAAFVVEPGPAQPGFVPDLQKNLNINVTPTNNPAGVVQPSTIQSPINTGSQNSNQGTTGSGQ